MVKSTPMTKPSNVRVCVIRPLSPNDSQFVPINEVPFLEIGERVFIGPFSEQKENHGPSGSHQRTICLPAGAICEAKLPSMALINGKLRDGAAVMQCVLREVAPGDTQWVPIAEVPQIIRGERLFTGVFRTQLEKHGPHGSHERNIALPYGAMSEQVAA